ncbi:hypothetical protein L810_5574 [Burkholderia sp. AU4i]|nr:hypothetical protein L810_5574 [Burkholderia sp. AU4i]
MPYLTIANSVSVVAVAAGNAIAAAVSLAIEKSIVVDFVIESS